MKSKLGKSIIDLILIEARNGGVKEITLKATLTAQNFYKKEAFRENRSQMTIEINGQKVRCFLMKMVLN